MRDYVQEFKKNKPMTSVFNQFTQEGSDEIVAFLRANPDIIIYANVYNHNHILSGLIITAILTNTEILNNLSGQINSISPSFVVRVIQLLAGLFEINNIKKSIVQNVVFDQSIKDLLSQYKYTSLDCFRACITKKNFYLQYHVGMILSPVLCTLIPEEELIFDNTAKSQCDWLCRNIFKDAPWVLPNLGSLGLMQQLMRVIKNSDDFILYLFQNYTEISKPYTPDIVYSFLELKSESQCKFWRQKENLDPLAYIKLYSQSPSVGLTVAGKRLIAMVTQDWTHIATYLDMIRTHFSEESEQNAVIIKQVFWDPLLFMMSSYIGKINNENFNLECFTVVARLLNLLCLFQKNFSEPLNLSIVKTAYIAHATIADIDTVLLHLKEHIHLSSYEIQFIQASLYFEDGQYQQAIEDYQHIVYDERSAKTQRDEARITIAELFLTNNVPCFLGDSYGARAIVAYEFLFDNEKDNENIHIMRLKMQIISYLNEWDTKTNPDPKGTMLGDSSAIISLSMTQSTQEMFFTYYMSKLPHPHILKMLLSLGQSFERYLRAYIENKISDGTVSNEIFNNTLNRISSEMPFYQQLLFLVYSRYTKNIPLIESINRIQAYEKIDSKQAILLSANLYYRHQEWEQARQCYEEVIRGEYTKSNKNFARLQLTQLIINECIKYHYVEQQCRDPMNTLPPSVYRAIVVYEYLINNDEETAIILFRQVDAILFGKRESHPMTIFSAPNGDAGIAHNAVIMKKFLEYYLMQQNNPINQTLLTLFDQQTHIIQQQEREIQDLKDQMISQTSESNQYN